jgi:hypothetical protein
VPISRHPALHPRVSSVALAGVYGESEFKSL